MAMYRCAACGSSRVVVDKKKEGFSVSKAVAGTVLFGFGGAAMGVSGKEQLYYHCAACGQVLSYPMPDITKKSIDRYLLDTEKNRYFLEREKKQYPNIEWNENASNTRRTLETGVQKVEKRSVNDLADEIWNYYLKNEIAYVSIKTLGNEIIKDDYDKISAALEILENRGVLIIEKIDDAHYCSFYSNVEDIKKNLYNIQNRSEEEKEVAQRLKNGCLFEVRRLKHDQLREKMNKTNDNEYVILKAAILKALAGDVSKTITDLQKSDGKCAEYSNQKLSAYLARMVSDGIIEKTVEEGRSKFSLLGASKRNNEKESQ